MKKRKKKGGKEKRREREREREKEREVARDREISGVCGVPLAFGHIRLCSWMVGGR